MAGKKTGGRKVGGWERIGHPRFGGRGLLDCNMHFICKMEHPLKKIVVRK